MFSYEENTKQKVYKEVKTKKYMLDSIAQKTQFSIVNFSSKTKCLNSLLSSKSYLNDKKEYHREPHGCVASFL